MHSDQVRAWRIALVGGVVYLAIVIVFLFTSGGQVEWFVKFGSRSSYTPFAHQVLGPEIAVPLDDGHDGQAFWLQARDPLLLDGAQMRSVFERPAYRSQRMLYPLIVSPGRLAGEQGLLWALVAVNLAAVVVGGYITARLARTIGAPDRAGYAFALNPTVFISVLMDFADALALALLLLTILLMRQERWRWAVVAAVGAVLTKEVGLLCLVGIALFTPNIELRRRITLVTASACAVGSWALYARWRLGWPPADVQEITPFPFYGYWDAYVRGWSQFGNWEDAIGAIAVLSFGLFCARRWRRRTYETNASLPLVALLPFMSIYVTDIMLNLIRVVAPAITLIALDAYAASKRKWSPP